MKRNDGPAWFVRRKGDLAHFKLHRLTWPRKPNKPTSATEDELKDDLPFSAEEQERSSA